MVGTARLELQRLADHLRRRPFSEVAPLLGYQLDPPDRWRWRREGSVINVTGKKFYDHLQGCDGGGATDLVIHGRGCSPAEAIRWPVGKPFVPEIEETVAPAVAKTFVPPEACERY